MKASEIRPNELRIGNYVYNSKKEITRITTLSEYTGVHNISTLKPIELNKEILLKCPQFVFDDMEDTNDDNTWFNFRHRSIVFSSDKSCNFNSVFVRINKETIEIKYLHDLQNKVKELTNEELTINL